MAHRPAWPIVLLMLAAAVLPAGAQPGPSGSFVVPEGDVRTVARDFATTGSLVVLGTLRPSEPGDFTLRAESIRVGPRGLIEAHPGSAGAAAGGAYAIGAGGAQGGSITLVADVLAVEEGGWILAGAGGDGGPAAGSTLAHGGRGGDGGSVRVLAAASIQGHVVPGAGGHGGPAVAAGAGGVEALGGDGGSAGRVVLEGALAFEAVHGPLPAAPPSSLQHATDGPTSLMTTCPTALPTGAPGVPGSPAGGVGGAACAVSQGADGPGGTSCTSSTSVVTPGEAGEQATATSRGGRGGDGVSQGAAGGVGEAYAIGGDGGDGGSGSLCGRPGAAGGAGGAAYAEAAGGTGGIALVAVVLTAGSGGTGGEAVAEATCGDGGRGGSGASLGAGPGGGNGGHGGGAGAGGADSNCMAVAEGGTAGQGDPPGASGDARAKVKGGAGGDGGAGNSPGGNAGDGGHTFAMATPGLGTGVLGLRLAEATPGVGGAGGPGDPDGLDGVPGDNVYHDPRDPAPAPSPPSTPSLQSKAGKTRPPPAPVPPPPPLPLSPRPPPSSGGGLVARSVLDVAAGADFRGAGLYDPATGVDCLALHRLSAGALPAQIYYAGLRYWPAGGAGADVPVPWASLPDRTGCLSTVRGSNINVNPVRADAGGAFWSSNLLGPNEVADLAGSSVVVSYCRAPSATAGPNGVVALPGSLEAFGAASLQCGGGFQGSHQLYPGCVLLPASSRPGQFDLDGPVFTHDGACNSLAGSGSLASGDLAVRHCVTVAAFDILLGPQGLRQDQDHFVVFRDGALAGWTTALGSPPALFPNVSGFSDDSDGGSAC